MDKYPDFATDLDDNMREALLEFLESENLEPDDIEYQEQGDGLYITLGNSKEWLLFVSDDLAREYAIESVKDMLETDADSFNQDWLQNHVSANDCVIFAAEEADSQVDNMSDDDILEQADTSELDMLQEEVDALYGAGRDEEAQAEEEKLNELHDDLIDLTREEIRERLADEIEQSIESDPIGYYSDNFGYSFQDMLKYNLITIETFDAAESAVDMDGIAHFLAHYDGVENGTPSGAVYYRMN